MAWFWLAIIGLLIPAYYGVYAYAGGVRKAAASERRRRTAATGSVKRTGRRAAARTSPRRQGMACWRIAAGWCAARCLHRHRLPVRQRPEPDGSRGPVAGAVAAAQHGRRALGTALNMGDPTLWPRWLLMFGLALGTTAVWLVFDADGSLRRTVADDYRRWAWHLPESFTRWAWSGLPRPARGTSSAPGRRSCGRRCSPGRCLR